MNKRIALVILFSTPAWAAPMIDHFGTWHDSAPERVEWAGGVVSGPNEAWLIETGWGHVATAEEIAAHAAAVSQAEAEALPYVDPQPAVYLPRFSVDITNVVGKSQALVDDASDEVVAVDETGSPEHTLAQKREQNEARKASRAAAKAAIESAGKNGKVNARLDAIEAALKELLK